MSTALYTLKRNAYGVVALLFLLAAMLPAILLPKLASAAQVTERSITMSSSVPSASASYQIKFTVATTGVIQGVVVDFCNESPIVDSSTCTLPGGMTVGTSVGTPTNLSGSWSGALANSNRSLVITNGSGGSVSSSTEVTIPVSGFTNPSAEGNFYARILTFAVAGEAGSHTVGSLTNSTDAGGVALSTAKEIGVTATVQETLVFCVSKDAPAPNCAGTSPPSIVLGTGTPVILDGAAVYDDTVFYQVSTNAFNTTQVRMKGASAALVSGSNTIPAIAGATGTAQSMDIGNANNVAAFGMRSNSSLQTGEGDVDLIAPYNNATSFGNNPTNITSTYGDIISQITGAALNKNIPLNFGATASPLTPAGVYTASFTLIASPSY